MLPAEQRDRLVRGYANYIEVDGARVENTFIVGSWVPAVQPYAHRPPMLITYNRPGPIAGVRATVDNTRAHPCMSVRNLALAVLLRWVQGRRRILYCGSFATPGNGHDLSLLSGLVVAHALGADYPFGSNAVARADFERMRGIMGL